MKIRTDFVSNSSSSSFIVATTYKDVFEGAYNICKSLGDLDDDLVEMLEKKNIVNII